MNEEVSYRTSLIVFLSAMFFAVGGVAAGCGSSDDEGCGADDECKGDRICEDGECTDPGGRSGNSSGGDSGGDSGGSTGGTDECDTSGDCPQVTCQCPEGPVNFQGCYVENGNGTCATEETCAADRYGACDGSGETSGGSSGGSTGGALGDACEFDSECQSNLCYKPGLNTTGYCTKACTDTFDCPGLWDCKDQDGTKICVKN